MERAQPDPVENRFLGLEALVKKIDSDPELTRRGLLGGMFALSALAVAQRLGIEVVNDRLERISLQADGCSPLDDISCYLQEAGLTDVPAAQVSATEAVVLPPVETTTTLSPTTTTIAPPPPPPPVEAPPPPKLEVAPRRDMSYGEFAANAELFLSKIPTLEAMNSMFTGTPFYHFVPEQKQHIDYLGQTVQLTPEKFQQFAFNTAFSNMFSANRRPLDPKMVLWHWTGKHYDSPDHLAHSMASSESSVQLYVHNDNIAYQLVSNLNVVMGHARALNPIAWGIEIYTGDYDNVRSPVFNYTPGTTESGIYAAVNCLRSAGLPVNAATLMGHYAADLIFMNPYYDPYSGTFHEIPGYHSPVIHKSDPPQEFMNMVVAKAVVLNQQLG